MEYEITDDEALRSYDLLMGFYNSFHSIEEYSLIKKKERNKEFGDRYDMVGQPMYSDLLFNDHTMEPKDMNFKLRFMKTQKENEIFFTLLNFVSSHASASVPGRQLKAFIYETNTNKVIGFLRVNSPTLNMKPRSVVLDTQVAKEYDVINNHMIVGTTIVPAQPFGYNCLGGKLIALLTASNEVRYEFDRMYNKKEDVVQSLIPTDNEVEEKDKVEIKFFETTSLYGSIKGMSQYDGLKPYIRNGGLTESAIIPAPTIEITTELYAMFKKYQDGFIFFGLNLNTSSPKLKKLTKIYSVVLNKLKEIDPEKFKKLKETMNEKKKEVTTKKMYYYSTYGVGNAKETLFEGADPQYNIPVERFDMDSMVEWWKKKAQKRYDKLKANGSLREEIELWTEENIDNKKFQIVR